MPLDTYSINGNTYLFTLRKSDGIVRIYNLVEDYIMETNLLFPAFVYKDDREIIGNMVTSYDWTDNKWDVARSFDVNGNNYLFLMGQTSNGTNVHINTINSNGTISSSYYNYDWSSGWTKAEFYKVGNNTYLYLYKQSNGQIHIHQMNSNGTVGSRVQTIASWLPNFTTVNFFYQNGSTYLFTQRYSDAHMYVFKMNSNGSRGTQIDFKDWSSLYTSSGVYGIGTNTNYLFMLKENNGLNYVTKLNSNGTIGADVQSRSWSSGYSLVHFFKFPTTHSNEFHQNYMLMLKSSNGLLRIHRVY